MPCHIFSPNRSTASIQEFDVDAGITAEFPLDKSIFVMLARYLTYKALGLFSDLCP